MWYWTKLVLLEQYKYVELSFAEICRLTKQEVALLSETKVREPLTWQLLGEDILIEKLQSKSVD